MNQDWIEKTNEQIQFLLNEPPSLENAKNLASLYIIQERLGSHHHVSPSQKIETLSDRLKCDLSDFSIAKAEYSHKHTDSNREHLLGVLDNVLNDVNGVLLLIYQSISHKDERECIKSLIEHWHKKLS